MIAVLPADPYIADEATFGRLVRLALAEARGAIVTIGVLPTHAETGFGYIRLGARRRAPGADTVHAWAVSSKSPTAPTAERYVASGEYRGTRGCSS